MKANLGLPLRAFFVLGTCLGAVIAARAQPCEPCMAETQSISDGLEEAFRLTLELADCAGTEHLESCRRVEALLDRAYTDLETLFQASAETAAGCLSCDPRPRLLPLASALSALAALLEEKGFEELTRWRRRVDTAVERWHSLSCCGSGAFEAEPDRNREEDARRILIEKCGINFVSRRQGLRQVFRVENDRRGCYQSRACRASTSYEGIGVQGGFWTYDGEYWYIWAERRTPRGDWVSCEP